MHYWKEFSSPDRSQSGFWIQYGNRIVNEVEEIIDQVSDENCKTELEQLKKLIEIDANIDSSDINVKRVLFIINMLINEFDQQVDYEDDGQDNEGMEANT